MQPPRDVPVVEVDELELQRDVDRDGRVQRAGRLPCLVPHASDVDVGVVGGQQRHRVAVARHHIAVPVGADDAELDALDRGVDVAGGTGRGGFLAEGVPRLDRPTQLDLHAVENCGADARETEFGERIKPAGLEGDAVRAQIGRHVGDVLDQEVRQQVSPVQVRAVPDQRGAQRFVPEPRHQRAHQQRLHHRHAQMRRHLEAAQLQEAEPAARAVGAVELVDAELGAMGVAGDVGEQVPQRAVGHPGVRWRAWRRSQAGDLGERDLEFVERLGAALVDPRRLRRGADESARRTGRTATGGAASRSAARPAGPGGAAAASRPVSIPPSVMWLPPPVPPCVPSMSNDSVDSRASRACSYRVSSCCVCSAKLAVGATLTSMTPGSGVIVIDVQPWVRRRSVALDHHRAVDLGRRGFDSADQVDEMFERLGGRHEDVQQAVANLGDHGGRRRGFVVLDHRVHRAGLRRQAPARRSSGRGQRRPRRLPADRIQRQPQTGRRIPLDQHDAAAAQPPVRAGPAKIVVSAVQRQHERRW